MGVKVGTACLHWPQPSVPRPPSCPQTLASTVSSPSPKRCSLSNGDFMFRCIQRLDQSAVFGAKLYRSRSSDRPKSRAKSIRRACSASLYAFSDEEFSKKIQELAMRFQLTNDGVGENTNGTEESEKGTDSADVVSEINLVESKRPIDPVEPPEWEGRDEIIQGSIERKANSVDLPLSLRIIKRKKQWQEGFREAGESACCSVKKAFSSMVFIIRELHSFTLQMRENLFYEDLQGILGRVQKDMDASFVWLFQQVFSHTPTLMVYVMILLANYSVHSMATNAAIAAPPPSPFAVTAESVSVFEDETYKQQKFDSSAIKNFSVASSSGKTTSIGGINGGGGKFRAVSSGTDGDGRFDESSLLNYYRTILPDGVSSTGNSTTREEESVTEIEEELKIWNSVVEEASRMQAASRDEALDQETMRRFVSPVTAKIEGDNYADYFRTELFYQMGLAYDPNNPLLLANYAQFLYLVAHDHDRADEYFKRAVKVEPPDAEALSKYATFLWQAKNDLWAAEETYLEAISADPSNSYYAANYAHFLWNTGGEDTCFPIDSNDGEA